jgi:hypothetical protein
MYVMNIYASGLQPFCDIDTAFNSTGSVALYKLNAKKWLYQITSKSPLKFVLYPKSKCMTATTFK